MIYLPTTSTPAFQSLNAPLFNIHDSHVTAPFFGPNVWVAALQPVVNGGIPSQHPVLELRLTFKEGGAFDFHTKFETLRERLQQAIEVARASETIPSQNQQVNLDIVHLDELPAYEEGDFQALPIAAAPLGDAPNVQTTPAQTSATPAEPPPGYEETQRDRVAESFERAMRF